MIKQETREKRHGLLINITGSGKGNNSAVLDSD